jgi:hypothetical protein
LILLVVLYNPINLVFSHLDCCRSAYRSYTVFGLASAKPDFRLMGLIGIRSIQGLIRKGESLVALAS